MKVMIMAGGTGGHIFPAAAVAEALQDQGHEIRWLGSLNGMEGTVVPTLGFEFCGLPVTAWHGGRLRKLLAPLNLIRAIASSLGIFRREQPDVVVGFGGYASAPGGIAAWLLNTPIVLHEQNGVPGLTNKKLEAKAAVVLQAFPDTFAKPYEVVGNPVRAAICALDKPTKRAVGQRRTLRILVLGGSQGAQAINEVVPHAISQSRYKKSIEVWHQTGKQKADATDAHYRKQSLEASVVEFVDDMAQAYSWCDLVVARSGASTVSELAAVGAYSILVPYPWHKDRQQFKNAMWLSDQGCAEYIDQQELTADVLTDRIDYWFTNRAELLNKSEQAWNMGVRDSAQRIVSVINECVSRKAA